MTQVVALRAFAFGEGMTGLALMAEPVAELPIGRQEIRWRQLWNGFASLQLETAIEKPLDGSLEGAQQTRFVFFEVKETKPRFEFLLLFVSN